jgi:hypothetical protein
LEVNLYAPNVQRILSAPAETPKWLLRMDILVHRELGLLLDAKLAGNANKRE